MTKTFRKIDTYLMGAIITVVLFFSSCNSPQKNDEPFHAIIDEDLRGFREILQHSNNNLYTSMKDKLDDPRTTLKMKEWYPKVIYMEALSKNMINYLDSNKQVLMRNKDFVIDEKYAANMLGKLKEYKSSVLQIDSSLTESIKDNIVLVSTSFESINDSQKEIAPFLILCSKDKVIHTLDILINNVSRCENRVLRFFHEKSVHDGIFSEDFLTYSAIIGQSSSYVKAGEKIEITAGIGSFTSHNNAEIIINNNPVSLSNQNIALYTFRAAAKPGKYTVPVKISYVDQDGNKQTIKKQVEYTVAE